MCVRVWDLCACAHGSVHAWVGRLHMGSVCACKGLHVCAWDQCAWFVRGWALCASACDQCDMHRFDLKHTRRDAAETQIPTHVNTDPTQKRTYHVRAHKISHTHRITRTHMQIRCMHVGIACKCAHGFLRGHGICTLFLQLHLPTPRFHTQAQSYGRTQPSHGPRQISRAHAQIPGTHQSHARTAPINA